MEEMENEGAWRIVSDFFVRLFDGIGYCNNSVEKVSVGCIE